MSELVESSRHIFVDPMGNNNKYYNMDLYDDGRIEANWGRVGASKGQSQTNTKGKRGFDATIRAKEKKGYVRTKTVQSETVTEVAQHDLGSIAKTQIKVGSSQAEKLIDRLVTANIHQITANTQIKFDSNSGLFQTPLGIVTPDGITEASGLLDKMYSLKKKDGPKFYEHAGNFLKIVPQNVGRNVRDFVDRSFTDREGIQKQKDLLDSLEASYNAIGTQDTTVTDGDSTPPPVEKLFDASIEVLDDPIEYKRISDHFYATKKAMHNYGGVKIKTIYRVNLSEMDAAYDSKSWGNTEEYYHGTGIANCLSILKSGLKISPPSSAKIAGKLFGNGVYGADCSSKSLGYSLGRWGQGASSDGAWLFVCDFAMGKTHMAMTYGRGGAPKGYDSITALGVNTGLHNNEFIVYNNDQVRIKYLIECSS